MHYNNMLRTDFGSVVWDRLNTRQSLRDAAFNPSGVEIFGISGGDGPSGERRSMQTHDSTRNAYGNAVSLELSDVRTQSGGEQVLPSHARRYSLSWNLCRMAGKV